MLTTSYRAEWNGIASRIEGLLRAREFFIRSTHPNTDRKVLDDTLLPESTEVYKLLFNYNKNHSECLPEQAKACLKILLTSLV